MHPSQDPHSPSGTTLWGPSTHHPPEEGEGGSEEQDQDQPHVLGPLVQALALLLCNLGERRHHLFVSAPSGPARGWRSGSCRAPSPPHLVGAETRQDPGLLEQPQPSPAGDEDVGQVEQEGRAELGAVFPWGRRRWGWHRANPPEGSGCAALLGTPVPIRFPSRKTTMLIISEPSQKRPRFL